MRVLLDENVPHDLITEFPGHDVLVILARSNRVPDLVPLVEDMREALERLQAGKVEHVGAAELGR